MKIRTAWMFGVTLPLAWAAGDGSKDESVEFREDRDRAANFVVW
jgi:hypothetical protein